MMNETEMARVVRRAIDGYFRDLDGEKACGVFRWSSLQSQLLLYLTYVPGTKRSTPQSGRPGRSTSSITDAATPWLPTVSTPSSGSMYEVTGPQL